MSLLLKQFAKPARKAVLSGLTWRCQLCSRNFLTTWSSLATAFNTKPVKKMYPNLMAEPIGLFGIPELQSPEGFYLLKERAVSQADDFVKEACNPDRKRKMVEIFDDLSDCLCRVADLAEFIRLAHPKPKFAQAAEDACISIGVLVEKLNTHRELYLALKKVVENNDKFSTTEVDNHVAKLFLFDFEQSGIHLEENSRQKAVHLNEYILYLGQRFMANCSNPKAVPKNALPAEFRNYFAEEGGNVIVSGLCAEHSNESVREAAYKVFLQHDPKQESILNELLNSRFELAKLCGFPTYSHRALRGSTAETPDMVNEFLCLLSDRLKARAAKDFAVMKEMKRLESKQGKDVYPWDPPYFSYKGRLELTRVSGGDVIPYFSLGSCMEGLDMLFKSLYGISLVAEDLHPGESWSPDIYKVKVVHEKEGLLGYIYCDFYERLGKPFQDCHFTIQGGRNLSDGSYQNPIVVLMLNFPSPTWGGPSLLTHNMVDNLFHEMGHALHSMLARTKYQHVTGTRCSTDFAEVPSVLMEYFVSDPRVISRFARHHSTGQPMPADALKALCASKHLFSASEMQLQTFYSALDQKYHSHLPLGAPTTEILEQIQSTFYGLPSVPDVAWQLRFSHLVGYGAKYYSYLMSRAIASWIWQEYFQADPFDPKSGQKYRHECLAHGGGKPSRKLVADFLGKSVNPENLVHSLVTEIDERQAVADMLRV